MKKVILLIFTGILCGCSLLGEKELLPLYTLKSGDFEPTTVLSFPLAVDMPLSEVSLNTPRIALTPSPYQRDYLADGQWPDRLPKIFQEVLLDSLTQRWGGTYVNRVSAGMQAKYILYSEIQDFSVYYLDKDHPEIRQKILFKLINLRDRHILSSRTFSHTIPVSSVTMKEIVEAFNKGLYCLLEEAVSWMEDVLLKESALNLHNDKLSHTSHSNNTKSLTWAQQNRLCENGINLADVCYFKRIASSKVMQLRLV